jgi:hypothetical protein
LQEENTEKKSVQSVWLHFKLSPVHVLRTKVRMCVAFSTDILSLRETVARRAFISVEPNRTHKAIARRAFISVEPHIIHPTIARRAFTKNDNLKGTHLF